MRVWVHRAQIGEDGTAVNMGSVIQRRGGGQRRPCRYDGTIIIDFMASMYDKLVKIISGKLMGTKSNFHYVKQALRYTEAKKGLAGPAAT
jgi:hypothetical protein